MAGKSENRRQWLTDLGCFSERGKDILTKIKNSLAEKSKFL
jgi:hypothetical protein